MHGQTSDESKQEQHRMRPVPCLPPATVTISNLSKYFSKDGRRIKIGDCALFRAGNAPPFIGIIRDLATDTAGNGKVVVNWLYRPADIRLIKGVSVDAAPNEIFYSFHRDEISGISLLHPCKVAFLRKGIDLPPGVSSFVCRRVYDTATKRLWWLTDRDYIDMMTEAGSLFSLPAKLGGLSIRDPVKTGDFCFQTSLDGTLVLSKAIKLQGAFDLNKHKAALSNSLLLMKSKRDEAHKMVLCRALDSLPPASKRAISRATDNKNSAWLTVMPLARFHFDLSANEFRDGLALRYMRLANLPATCDGCGEAFNVDHFLNCKTGGLIIGRHNEIQDAIGDLAAQAWGHSNVWKEPVIVEANSNSGIMGLQADLAVRGVWEPQGDALFDIRVVNTDALSYRSRSVVAVLKSAAQEKKNKYGSACEDRHSSFTPLVLSVDGVFEQEAASFTRRIAERLAAKWDKSFGETMGWVRARLSFAILRATSMCLRGTRVRWRCLGFEDGAGVSISMN